MDDLGLILCLALLVQEVSFTVKQVSSHLDVICLVKKARKRAREELEEVED